MTNLQARCREKKIFVVGLSKIPWELRTNFASEACVKFGGACAVLGLGDAVEDGVAAHVGVNTGLLRTARDAPVECLGNIPAAQLIEKWDAALRTVHPDVWIVPVERRLLSLVSDKTTPTPFFVIVSDVRFSNEAAWITRVGGALVHFGEGTPLPGVVHTVSSAEELVAFAKKHFVEVKEAPKAPYDPDRDVCALL